MKSMNLCRHCMSRFEPVDGIKAVKTKKDDCYFSSILFDQNKIRMKVVS